MESTQSFYHQGIYTTILYILCTYVYCEYILSSLCSGGILELYITQKDAENILAQSVNLLGSFLVRDNEIAPGNYFLSVKDTNTVNHYQIRSLDDGGFFITLRLTFETITHLILHYSQQADGLCMTLKCAAIMLRQKSDDSWEIDHNAVRATKLIEVGQLCEIFEGVWNNTTPVTIYTHREGFMSENEFLEAAELMKQLKHSNIIKLYGVCRKKAIMHYSGVYEGWKFASLSEENGHCLRAISGNRYGSTNSIRNDIPRK